MRVVIAEDSVLLREGVVRLLTDAGFEVLAACGNADELLERLSALDPPTSPSSTSACRPPTPTRACAPPCEIREQRPSIGVLVLSQYVELGLAMELLAGSAEGIGYLLKDRIGDVAEFVAAVRRVAGGGSALDPVDRLDAARRGAAPTTPSRT